jgi:hypothetical protein
MRAGLDTFVYYVLRSGRTILINSLIQKLFADCLDEITLAGLR